MGDVDEGFVHLDILELYVSQVCGTDFYSFRFMTWDLWSFVDFFAAYVEIDSDFNLSTGCNGVDYVGVVDGFDGYRGPVFSSPSCDASRWTVTGELFGTREGPNDITLLMNVAAIGNPPGPLRMAGGLENVYDPGPDFTSGFTVGAAPLSFSNGRCSIPTSDSTTNRDVARLYLAFFLRGPDQDGLNYWVPRYRNGELCLNEISEGFARSGEFQNRYGTLDDTGYVELVYGNVLGRAPDAAGRQFWLGRLSAGATRGAVMVGFAESPEFRQRVGLA